MSVSEALEVVCPKCKAGVNQPCFTWQQMFDAQRQQVRLLPHDARYDAADAQRQRMIEKELIATA